MLRMMLLSMSVTVNTHNIHRLVRVLGANLFSISLKRHFENLYYSACTLQWHKKGINLDKMRGESHDRCDSKWIRPWVTSMSNFKILLKVNNIVRTQISTARHRVSNYLALKDLRCNRSCATFQVALCTVRCWKDLFWVSIALTKTA